MEPKQEGDNIDSGDKTNWRLLVLLIASVLLVWATSWFFITALLPEDKRGQFGDMFGAVNSLFSGLAFAGLFFAIWLQHRQLKMQKKELALQREELGLTRTELQGQKEALTAQNETLKRQNFESTFFQLLRQFNEVVDATRVSLNGKDFSGREALRELYGQRLQAVCFHQLDQSIKGTQRPIKAYEKFYKEWHHLLGHYFRFLYHIFMFVERSALSYEEKCVYANIVRAQLSTHELALLFYNGLWGDGKKGFKPLIERYGILKPIYPGALLQQDSDRHNPEYYHPYAFLGREERTTRVFSGPAPTLPT